VNDLRELERLEPVFWRAPSAHNTQPWLLRYGAHRIELGYDPGRALPAADSTSRDLLLSLGALVEAALTAAAGAEIAIEFEPSVDLDAHLVGAFVPAAEPYRTAFAAEDLTRRRTSRLPYVPGRLEDDDLAAARDELSPEAALHELPTADLVELFRRADRRMYESSEVVAELRAWLRLSRRDARYALDGLSYDCLALSRLEAAAVGLLLRPWLYPLVRRAGLHRQFGSSTAALLEREGSALVLVGPADTPDQLVGHGRTLLRVWLALTRRGLYTHPLSQIIDCPATERELGARLGVADDTRLLSVFRTGRSDVPTRSHRLR
jgi:hypothetical protein